MSELSFPRIIIVDAPTFDANVRFDLNSTFGAATCVTNAEGFSLGAPTLQGDPGAVGGTYGDRQITLTPRIQGPKAAARSLLSTLARELLRWENWLLVQLDALTEPVWFHLYRSTPGALSLDEVDVEERLPDAWQTTLSLTADAFALGERITLLPMTFTQSPTGLSAALPAIRGDAPTPLRIQITPGAGFTAGFGPSWMASVMAGPAYFGAVLVDVGTGDGLSGGTTGSGATYFGGTYRAFSPTANPATTTLGGPFPVVPIGKYKVQVRGEFDRPANVAPTYRLRFSVGRGIGDTVTVAPTTFNAAVASTAQRWVDLGEFSFPANGVTLPQDVAIAAGAQQALITMAVDTTVPSGSVRLDAIRLTPVDCPDGDARTLVVGFDPGDGSSALGAGHVGTIDGDDEIYWGTYSGGVLFPGVTTMLGGFPVADPAAEQNLLTLMAIDRGYYAGAGTTITSLGATATVVPSYQPKYLHLPGDPDA